MKHIVIACALAVSAPAQTTRPTDARAADVAAIRAHIESIFQAFIDKDVRALERTHGVEWRGFMPGSPEPIRGRDGYMKVTSFVATQPKGQGSVAYRISNFDVVFYGDTAVASFVAETDAAFGGEKMTQKLTRLAFPRTELQAYGSTVILYTSYEIDVTKDGRTRTERGLATEVFVQQDGRWLNTAWQLSPASNR